MKPQICENCGAHDFKEQEDAYVCAYCDTYYLKSSGARTSEPKPYEEPKEVHFGEVVDRQPDPAPAKQNKRKKNKWISLILCVLFGVYGFHKFYEGKIFMGLLYLFTQGLFGIGWIVDIILILLKPNSYYV